MNKHFTAIIGLAVLLAAAGRCPAADIDQAFQRPPDAAKPLTWWHWIDGNVTKPGITRDLESMKRAGLGGCYLFSIGGYFPKGPAVFGEPGWYDLLSHTVNEAARLGLEFGVHNCDGWSESGGPWITPETSMKELTYGSVDVSGAKAFDSVLPAPAGREGFYRDIAVIAFPLPAGGRLGAVGAGKAAALTDGKASSTASYPIATNGHKIELTLSEPGTLRSMVFHNVTPYGGDGDLPVFIEASADGNSWQPAGECSLGWDTAAGQKTITVGFDEVEARMVRLSFTNEWDLEIGEIELSDAARVHFAEAKAAWLRARGHGGESPHLARYPGPERHRSLPADHAIRGNRVLDLTSRMAADGRLKWLAPEGRWRVLRIGYTSNGRQNKPATEAGRGLECDKLNPEVVRFHLDQYVERLTRLFGEKTGKVFRAVETDSWECDVQNWTAGLEKRFEKRLGFDLLRWMPLLLEGWIIESPDASERVLWDWRRFLADQFAENYFAEVKRYLAARNLTYVCEGSGRQMYNYDAIGYQRDGDVPMGEFWLNTGLGQGVRVDNKVAASVAHITGKRLVASESYTASARFARWQNHPYTLKPLGDRAFCAGVNQFVFHTFAHQPHEVTGPGFTMAMWGLNCNRANTWWEPGAAWMQYLARCNYLLREGRFVADVLSFVGEEVPNRIGWRNELQPALPEGYDFDGCDAKALFEATVKDGRILLPSGMQYRVLLLPNKATIRPAVLRKIAELVKDGATLVGARPEQSPSMVDLDGGDTRVRQIAGEVWGRCDGRSVKENQYGRGRVFWGLTFPEVFARLDLVPDFGFVSTSSDPEIIYIHRAINGGEFYFVSNQKARAERITARFRIKGRQPEIWDPVSGEIKRPAAFKPGESVLELPLALDPAGSVFVVFRAPLPKRYVASFASGNLEAELTESDGLFVRIWGSTPGKVILSDGTEKTVRPQPFAPIALSGPWKVEFPPNLGAPSSAVFDKLVSWTERPEQGIRYFSGTATYTTEFEVSPGNLGGDRELWLDLGDVQVIAQVRINGTDLGILWKPPFRVNATAAVQPGRNQIEIRVTSLWPNRMIGDEQMPDSIEWRKKGEPLPTQWPDWLLEGKPRPDGRIIFCTRKPYKKEDPLLESGLIGPVRLVFAERVGL